MKNKKILALLAMTVVFSSVMTACSFGGDEPEQVVVEATPTPKPTQAPTPTPAPANSQDTTYTSADKSISIKLPDATWANKNDTNKMVSFESPKRGKLLILHGEGDEAMAAALIPDSQDIAAALEQAADLEPGVDFNILNYSAENIGGVDVYSYTVEYLTDKSNYSYVVNKYFANENEYYSVAASVKKGKNAKRVMNAMKKCVDSFVIKGDSSLKAAAPDKKAQPEAEGNTDAADTAGNSESTEGQSSSTGSTNSGNVSDAALSDNSQTRTIYDNNNNGAPRVIYSDGNGGWYDDYGNSFTFATEEDAYDQNDNSFYYHGEAADVYYMPVE